MVFQIQMNEAQMTMVAVEVVFMIFNIVLDNLVNQFKLKLEAKDV